MHELSIAAAIVEIAVAYAEGRKIRTVYVRVGYLRQVVPEALAFSFQLVAEGTLAEGARLAIESIPIEAHCRRCATHSRLGAFPLLCQACDGADLEITAGEELAVESLDLEELDLQEV